MRRSADVVRGMAALALLAGLVVGVPILLWMWAGWPLPSSVPSWAGISEAWADRYVPDAVWLSALAVVAWVAWAWLTAAVVVEVLAVARERVATRVPLAGPLQSWAHRLVGTAALVTSLLGTRPALAEPAPLPPPPAVAVVGADAPELAPAFATANAAAPSSTALPTYTVERRDDLWSIAEEHLGDPYRWQEVFELNVGCPQADGGCLEEPDLIQPGWVFELPADATGLAPPPPPPPLAPPTAVSPRVEIPEAPAEATVGQDSAATRAGPLGPPAAMRGEGPSASTTTTVTSAPQPEPQELPTPEPGQELPSRGSAPAPARETVASTPAAGVGDEAGSTATVVLAGSGLLAAGVVLCLNRLRRVQQRRRRPGRRIRMPEGELVETERSLRVGADESGADVVDVVLRSMTEAAGQLDQALPDVVAVELDQSSLRVVFAAPPPSPPQPWEADVSRRLWELQLGDMDLDELRTLVGKISAPLPTLVSLGDRDGSQVLVNLEGTGVTEIVAEADRAQEVLAALALELTTCPWADFVDVVLVGFGDELEWLERARRAEALGDVVAALEREAYGLAELLDSSGWPNVVSARVQGAAADWIPTVVLCATDLDDDTEERLAKLSGEVRHAGVTVVVAGEVAEAQRRLVVDSDRVRVEPLGLYARRERWLAEDQLQAVVALLEVAGDTDDVAPGGSSLERFFEVGEEPVESDAGWPSSEAIDEEWADSDWSRPGQPVSSEPDEEVLDARAQAGRVLNGLVYDDVRVPEEAGLSDQSTGPSNGARPSPAVPSRAERWVDPGEEAEVEVRVLGPVEVVGRGPAPRTKSLEAIVYLAMHRHGVDSDKVRCALWPEGSTQRSTWDTTASVARTWLGEANGTLLLPKTYHNRGMYRLEDLLSTDYERFGAAVALAQRLDGPPAVTVLRSALELVRGPLFDGEGCKWEWPRYEGHVAVLEAQVVDAALGMSGLCLEAGDAAGATWAVHQAQQVSPYDERLYRVLMAAADHAGNPAGVEAAWEDLCEKVEADIEPYDQVHPETLALYKELGRSRKTLAGSGRRR